MELNNHIFKNFFAWTCMKNFYFSFAFSLQEVSGFTTVGSTKRSSRIWYCCCSLLGHQFQTFST